MPKATASQAAASQSAPSQAAVSHGALTAASASDAVPTQDQAGGRAAWRRALDMLRRPVRADRAGFSRSATVNMQLWLGHAPWRLTAGWAALAGVLAGSRFLLPLPLSWPTLVLLFLLVDPLWGSVWRLAGGRAELLPLHQKVIGQPLWLPYLQAGSPAAKLFANNTNATLPVLFRVAFPAVLMTLLVASALGWTALLLTGVLIVVTLLGWIDTRRGHVMPVFLHSVVTIGLPWLLAALLVGATPETDQWRALVLLLGLWVVHEWGSGRLALFAQDRLGQILMGVADGGIGLLLIWLQTPFWLAVWTVLTLPTWLQVVMSFQQNRTGQTALPGADGLPISSPTFSPASLDIWQLAAMLVSALAVGQSIF